MNGDPQRQPSLPTRATISVLVVMLCAIWALVLFANKALREDVERQLGEQQFATASQLASTVSYELRERRVALETSARLMGTIRPDDTNALQDYLESHPLLLDRFDGGVRVSGTDGVVLATMPRAADKAVIGDLDRADKLAAISEGRSVIGKSHIDTHTQEPVVTMAVPMRDRHGQVSGVLTGGIKLGASGFLRHLVESRYAASGDFLLISPRHREIITASDPSRNMERLPPAGVNPAIDRFLDGYEGTVVMTNPRGVEVVASDKRVPETGWILAVTMPTASAFASVTTMQHRVVLAALLVSAFAALLTRWVLRRQWVPVALALKTLTNVANSDQQWLTVPGSPIDEVDQLVAGFNKMLGERRSSELALNKSEAFGRLILNSVTSPIVVLDRDGAMIAVNESWQRYAQENGDPALGQGAEAWLGTNYLEFMAPRLTAYPGEFLEVSDGIYAVLDGHLAEFSHECACDAPDQPPCFVLRVTPLGVDTGGVVIVHTDISDYKRVAHALRTSEDRLSLALRGMDEAVWDWDVVSNTVFRSVKWLEMLGYAKDEPIGESGLWQQLIHPDDQAAVATAFSIAALGDTDTFSAEFRMRHKEGHWLPVLLRSVLVRDAKRTVTRVVGAVKDLSELKRAEAALQAAVMDAERANNAKSRFLAAASHDLRQPLGALALYVGVIRSRIEAEHAELMSHIQDCVESLSELLDDLLDISKLDAGVVKPTLSDLAIDEELNALVSIHAAEARLKGLRLRARHSTVIVRTDRTLLRRILGNLLTNAIRYTERGGVLMACRLHGGEPWVEIWDTGIGIAAEDTEAIFEEFRQLGDGARNHGSGLGLAIVGKAVTLLGLEIRLRSRPGRGSLFAVRLPPGSLPVPGRLSAVPPIRRSVRIGLVEDNPQVRRALSFALAAANTEVVTASSGAELLQQLAGRAPDVIISDYRLGNGETGFDTILVARAAFGEDLPALLITGDTEADVIRSMADRGIAVLHKPLDFNALHLIISEAANRGVK